MKKALSILCYLKRDDTMPAIEVEYPVSIDSMCDILRHYNKPEYVDILFEKGNIMFLDVNPITCVPASYPQRYTNTIHKDLAIIKKQYPYVYLYDEFTERWYFCHDKSYNYNHNNIITIEKVCELNNAGKLFTLPTC